MDADTVDLAARVYEIISVLRFIFVVYFWEQTIKKIVTFVEECCIIVKYSGLYLIIFQFCRLCNETIN